MTKKLTPYQRIVRASERGAGVHLSAAEVRALAGDQAIITRSDGDDDREAEERGLDAEYRARKIARGYEGT